MHNAIWRFSMYSSNKQTAYKTHKRWLVEDLHAISISIHCNLVIVYNADMQILMIIKVKGLVAVSDVVMTMSKENQHNGSPQYSSQFVVMCGVCLIIHVWNLHLTFVFLR